VLVVKASRSRGMEEKGLILLPSDQMNVILKNLGEKEVKQKYFIRSIPYLIRW